jgi:hypothetical protein
LRNTAGAVPPARRIAANMPATTGVVAAAVAFARFLRHATKFRAAVDV